MQQQQEMPESAKFWASLLTQLEVSGGSRELANHCVLLQHENQQFVLQLDKMALHNVKREQDIYNALQRHFSGSVQLQIQKKTLSATQKQQTPAALQAAAKVKQNQQAWQTLENDSTVKALKNLFGAEFDRQSLKILAKGIS